MQARMSPCRKLNRSFTEKNYEKSKSSYTGKVQEKLSVYVLTTQLSTVLRFPFRNFASCLQRLMILLFNIRCIELSVHPLLLSVATVPNAFKACLQST